MGKVPTGLEKMLVAKELKASSPVSRPTVVIRSGLKDSSEEELEGCMRGEPRWHMEAYRTRWLKYLHE